MTIKKFQGRTEEEAIAKAKEEFGAGTVIMNVKEVRPKGFFRSFKTSMVEVTAAIEETEIKSSARQLEPVSVPEAAPEPSNINMAADEPISIPRPNPMKEVFASVESTWSSSMPQGLHEEVKKDNSVENNLEEKLESLQSLLEKKLVQPADSTKETLPEESPMDENLKFIKMIYGILLENDVDEKYVNQIIDELEKVNWNGNSVDYILSNVYQKMILKFGQPRGIDFAGRKPKVIFFVGPTGVGKTTTVAKVASKLKVEQGRRIAFLTADTYRIAAAEQLRTYANILDIPLTIVYSAMELNQGIEQLEDYDAVLVDTAGFSHKSPNQKEDVKSLIQNLDSQYSSEVYLVLSATTKYKDLAEISDVYKEISDYKIIFTKLDETTTYGNILNIKLYSGAEVSYITNGQNVPDDLEIFNSQKMVKRLLGGS